MSRTVDVCVCTFRRPTIMDTLASLAKQKLLDGWKLRVIVADNDATPSARGAVERAFSQYGHAYSCATTIVTFASAGPSDGALSIGTA